MCIYHEDMGIFIPNMKFLCVTLWLEGMCTDDDEDTNIDNNDDDGQSMIVEGYLADKPNEPSR